MGSIWFYKMENLIEFEPNQFSDHVDWVKGIFFLSNWMANLIQLDPKTICFKNNLNVYINN